MASGIGSTNLGGLSVSSIGFGCMGITAFYGAAMDDGAAVDLLRGVYEEGCTHFDTAEVYRSSFTPGDANTKFNETMIGAFLRTVPRDSFTVATKYMGSMHGGYHEDAVAEAVNASLQRLGLEHIDLYYLHRMPETKEELGVWMNSAKKLVGSGKIKHLGLSEVPAEWLSFAHAIHPIAAIQMEWSLLTRDIETTVLPTCKELGIGVVCYSPLARNLLAAPPSAPPEDWRADQPRYSAENLAKNAELCAAVAAMGAAKSASASQMSLAWLYARAAKLGVATVPIPGTTKLKHAKENMGSLRVTLTDDEMTKLEDLAKTVAGARGNEAYMKSTHCSRV